MNETAPAVEEWVDGEIALADWDYRNGEFVLDFEHSGDRPRTVTITESVQRVEGAGSMTIVQERVIPGESTVRVPVQRRGGEAGISISTRQSVDNGRAVFVSTGMQDQNPFSAFGGTFGLFVGVGVTTLMALLAAWLTLRSESDGVEVAT